MAKSDKYQHKRNGNQFEPTTFWRNVAHPALLNRHRDLSWMVAHEILPVRAVMHSRGSRGAGEDLTPQLVLYGVGRMPIPSKAFTKFWPTLTCLKEALWSSRNLPGREKRRDHSPGSGHGSHGSPGVVRKEGGLDPRRRVPHNTLGPGGHGLTALQRRGRCA